MPRKNRVTPHQFYRSNHQCRNKKCFRTKQLAQEVIVHQKLIQPFDDLELTTYRCPICQGWHLTSKKPVQPGNFHLN